jgi:hypothetical protein
MQTLLLFIIAVLIGLISGYFLLGSSVKQPTQQTIVVEQEEPIWYWPVGYDRWPGSYYGYGSYGIWPKYRWGNWRHGSWPGSGASGGWGGYGGGGHRLYGSRGTGGPRGGSSGSRH